MIFEHKKTSPFGEEKESFFFSKLTHLHHVDAVAGSHPENVLGDILDGLNLTGSDGNNGNVAPLHSDTLDSRTLAHFRDTNRSCQIYRSFSMLADTGHFLQVEPARIEIATHTLQSVVGLPCPNLNIDDLVGLADNELIRISAAIIAVSTTIINHHGTNGNLSLVKLLTTHS